MGAFLLKSIAHLKSDLADGVSNMSLARGAPAVDLNKFGVGGAPGAAEGVAMPGVLDVGCVHYTVYLALVWIDLHGRPAAVQRCLGRKLATQHRATVKMFGWRKHST